jgi:glycogen synthase
MRIALLTNEYPPHIYGGAGVHVDYLSRELIRLENGKHSVQILCFGNQEKTHTDNRVTAVASAENLSFQNPQHKKLFDALHRNVIMAGSVKEADLVHCHTWYTHFAGCLLKQLMDIPLVLTAHSLEPHRPWKEEQLGSAYAATMWLEKTAYENAEGVIAVSRSTKKDVHDLYGVPLENVRVIHNGIDADTYKPTTNPDLVASYGIDPHTPFVLFVGRITQQKGIIHLLDTIPHLAEGIQIVLCAGAPDTEDIGKEMQQRVEEVRARSQNRIIWISEILPTDHLVILYSHAFLFACPSVYEPFGIINLEAMACNTPVVASEVGGIPEIVVPDETGILVPFEPVSENDPEPKNPDRYARDLAAAINQLMTAPEKIKTMGDASRKRVEKYFSWKSIAAKTLECYRQVIERHRKREKG